MDDEEDGPLQGGSVEPPQKKRRGKSKEQKDFDKVHDYSTIQVKLDSYLQPEFAGQLGGLLAMTADTMSVIALESYQLANLHVSRLRGERKALPVLNQGF